MGRPHYKALICQHWPPERDRLIAAAVEGEPA